MFFKLSLFVSGFHRIHFGFRSHRFVALLADRRVYPTEVCAQVWNSSSASESRLLLPVGELLCGWALGSINNRQINLEQTTHSAHARIISMSASLLRQTPFQLASGWSWLWRRRLCASHGLRRTQWQTPDRPARFWSKQDQIHIIETAGDPWTRRKFNVKY